MFYLDHQEARHLLRCLCLLPSQLWFFCLARHCMNTACEDGTQHLLTCLLNADADLCATEKHVWGSLGGQRSNSPAPGSADLQQWSAAGPQVHVDQCVFLSNLAGRCTNKPACLAPVACGSQYPEAHMQCCNEIPCTKHTVTVKPGRLMNTDCPLLCGSSEIIVIMVTMLSS